MCFHGAFVKRRHRVSEDVGEGLVPSRRKRFAAGAHEGLPYVGGQDARPTYEKRVPTPTAWSQ